MTSAWGKSWGTAWGSSWGAIAAPRPARKGGGGGFIIGNQRKDRIEFDVFDDEDDMEIIPVIMAIAARTFYGIN
jgi:hypothetical protein